MTTISEQQWNPIRMLLCRGDEPHISDLPKVGSVEGATGEIRCVLCGEAMSLVDVLVIERDARLEDLAFRSRPPLYTTAKLNPLAVLGAIAREASKEP